MSRKGLCPLKLKQGCSHISTIGALSPSDPCSYAQPEFGVIKHVSLSLNVDFERNILRGQALIDFDVSKKIGEVILDVKHLTIDSLELADGTPLQYRIDGEVPNFRSKLTISLPTPRTCGRYYLVSNKPSAFICCTECSSDLDLVATRTDESSFFENKEFEENNPGTYETDTKNYDRLQISIKYSTDPTASALHWLSPKYTLGKKYPYLYSQCQPIHARSILPCQDTPAVKFTYDAEVSAPAKFTVLMSALRRKILKNKTFFTQPMPIPSYLMTIAVGVVESRTLGPRSTVWAEKKEIEHYARQLAEAENYLQAAERLCGPYEWNQFNFLVLPPSRTDKIPKSCCCSFPFPGMENPCLAFLNPFLLKGNIPHPEAIVHEMMHSWTGNLVTNNTFAHYWLNEGFTVFLERKVRASLFADADEGRRNRDLKSLNGLRDLKQEIINLGVESNFTRLVPDLSGFHPDENYSLVPYEKGSLFLRYLEDLVGGSEVFDDFVRSYINHFRKKSLDTNQFKAYLLDYFRDSDRLANVDWDTWLYNNGMPPLIPNFDTSNTNVNAALVAKILTDGATFSYEDIRNFSSHQLINLLQELIDCPALPIDKLRELGAAYRVADSNNSEILYWWLRLCVRSKDNEKLPEVFDFINSQGRMKFIQPLYRDLYAWEEVRQQAIENFLDQEPYMMHVPVNKLRDDLHLNSKRE